MSKDKHLFIVDLDGTSLKNHYELHENLKKTFTYVRNLGHKVTILTGRPYNGAIDFHNELNLNGVLGTLNGNKIIDTNNDKIIAECKMKSKSLKNFIEFKQNINHVIDFAWEHNGVIYSTSNVVKLIEKWYKMKPWEIVSDTKNIPNKITCAFVMIKPKDYKAFEDFFKDKTEIICHKWETLNEGMQVYELFNSACTKGTAVKVIAKHYKISLKNTHVFGDGKNDIQMFTLDKVNSYAVGNAHNDLVKYADKKLEFKNTEGAVGIEIMNIIKKG